MKHSYAEQHPDVDELLNSHSELVRKIAWQIHGRARHITEIEDIIQIGYTGLIIAAQNYTPLDGASFASYASIRIRGAIVDFLRKNSNLCRTTIQIKKQYYAAVQKLERQLLRQPNRLEIADEMDCSLIDMRFVKPLDEDLITKLARKHKLLVTLEENMIAGGAGSAVNEFLNNSSVSTKILNVGIPDNFPSVGSPADQKTEADLEKTKIIKQINKKLNL